MLSEIIASVLVFLRGSGKNRVVPTAVTKNVVMIVEDFESNSATILYNTNETTRISLNIFERACE